MATTYRRSRIGSSLFAWLRTDSPLATSFPPLAPTGKRDVGIAKKYKAGRRTFPRKEHHQRMSNVHDMEKATFRSSSADEKLPYGLSSETIPGEVVVVERPKFLQKCVDFMGRIGGEQRGIERVLPHEKTNQKPFDNFSVWYIPKKISMLTS
jgi:hypothetical protein